jgi:hypothetical protein
MNDIWKMVRNLLLVVYVNESRNEAMLNKIIKNVSIDSSQYKDVRKP